MRSDFLDTRPSSRSARNAIARLAVATALMTGASGCAAGAALPVEDDAGAADAGAADAAPGSAPDSALPTGPACVAGRYEGRFEGTTMYRGSVLPVTGTWTIELVERPHGEFFDIVGGRLEGAALDTYPFEADVSGTLDCNTLLLQDGALRNGWVMGEGADASFEGTLAGRYVPHEHRFVDGEWSMTEVGGDGAASGTWEAALTE